LPLARAKDAIPYYFCAPAHSFVFCALAHGISKAASARGSLKTLERWADFVLIRTRINSI